MRFAVVDLETSGLNPKRDEIVEIAIVSVNDLIVVDEYSSLIKPENYLDLDLTKIHGIDNDMLMIAPEPDDVKPEIEKRFTGAVLVEHARGEFDSAFLRRFLGNEPWDGIFNTLEECRNRYSQWRKYDLSTVCKRMDIDLGKHHEALEDARATAKVLIKLLTP